MSKTMELIKMITKINITTIDFTQERQEKVNAVQKEMELIINSSLFKEKILNLKNPIGELSVWKDATREQIYEHILSGKETLNPSIDNVIDITVQSYFSWKNVVGYTYPNTTTIYVNTKYFDSNNLSKESHHRKMTGSNFIHEYGHKLGFSHDFYSTSKRPFSLCYLLNEVYEECWDDIIAPKLEHKVIKKSYKKWLKTYTTEVTELHGEI
jgi:hypothetical protein